MKFHSFLSNKILRKTVLIYVGASLSIVSLLFIDSGGSLGSMSIFILLLNFPTFYRFYNVKKSLKL